VRLATYENKAEANLLESFFVGRSGKLENTVFAILSSDGKRKLVNSSRGPIMTFGGTSQQAVRDMVDTLSVLSLAYPGKKDAKREDALLPVLADLRLAINVAACDNLPLVLIVGDGKSKASAELEENVRRVAWSDEFAGRALYVRVTDVKQLTAIEGADVRASENAGVWVVQSDTFGLKGKTLAKFSADADAAKLKNGLLAAATKFDRQHRRQLQHVADGREKGIDWKTVVPVTDPGRPPGRGFGRSPRP
jgi:hypothetical protein